MPFQNWCLLQDLYRTTKLLINLWFLISLLFYCESKMLQCQFVLFNFLLHLLVSLCGWVLKMLSWAYTQVWDTTQKLCVLWRKDTKLILLHRWNSENTDESTILLINVLCIYHSVPQSRTLNNKYFVYLMPFMCQTLANPVISTFSNMCFYQPTQGKLIKL